MIEAEMIRIRDSSKHADIFEKLIKAVLKSNIILLIKAYLKKKHKGKAPYDATVDEQISKDINDISSKFMVNAFN